MAARPRQTEEEPLRRRETWNRAADVATVGQPNPPKSTQPPQIYGAITAGAAIALGLTAIGVGTRYQLAGEKPDVKGERVMHLFQMDGPLAFIVVFLALIALIGLGITFFGLAYHHFRRHHEHLREQEKHAALRRTTV